MFLSLPASLLALTLALPCYAATGGSFAQAVPDTKVSAMMMFLGNSQKVYIIDKAQNNAAQINGHPAWGAVMDLNTLEVDLMDIKTNTFCASGMHSPNGSYVTFGGNGAVGPGGNLGSVPNPGNFTASYDATYEDYDGLKSIRILNPCTSQDDFSSPNCQWFDNPDVLSMQKARWYAGTEALGDGSVVLMGGFQSGGYVNRNVPNVDPGGSGAEPTYEFYPANGRQAQVMNFMVNTSGLNAYALAYLMPSGNMFVQANFSTILWDYNANKEYPLPDMPGRVIRVYPGSGANAMLPLTPANNYTPTILFCGGSDMPADDWGDYLYPYIDTWNYPASTDCQRITPEPTDGTSPDYEQDDDMIDRRTMGQFIILPTGQLLVVNGALNGTAGYHNSTKTSPVNPYVKSLANGIVGTPALYDPNAPKGSRWSNTGLGTSTIARFYHSSAILLPDASVLIAGSNPNYDVDLTAIYPTEYRAEFFYPPYFSATTRPQPSGLPSTLSYGGSPFDVTIPASSYSGSSNDAADGAIVAVIRTGWTTHAMNMGQRFLQLNHTYTINSDGSFVLHCAQMPPNANIFQPGPAFIYVTINGVPSNGSYVIVGNGQISTQPLAAASQLPGSVRLDSAKGTADGSSTATPSNSPTKGNGNGAVSVNGMNGLALSLIAGALVMISMF